MFIILISFFLLTSCLESDKTSPPIPPLKDINSNDKNEDKKDIVVAPPVKKIPRPKSYDGQIARSTVTIELLEKAEEISLIFTPKFSLEPRWQSQGVKPVHSMADALTGGGGGFICNIEYFTFKEFFRVPLITDNITSDHLDFFLDDIKVDFEHDAEWLYHSDYIEIIIQNYRKAKNLKVENKTVKEYPSRRTDAGQCPSGKHPYGLNQPKSEKLSQSSYFHFDYKVNHP